ncbi:MAG: multiheme c-type cytochrome [bacterium]
MKSALSACTAALVMAALNCSAGDAVDASLYVGVKSCKMCHKGEKKGDQFGKWEASLHGKAHAVLADAGAKAVAAKLGIDNPQASGKCLRCHSTAYNFTETKQSEAVPVEEGVSCESCHGAGKNYKSMATMKSRDASIKGGMVYPATKSCEKCHNSESPTWNTERYTTGDGKKSGFDVEQAEKKIEHPNPNTKK